MVFPRYLAGKKNEEYSRVEKQQEGRSRVGQRVVSDKVADIRENTRRTGGS